MEGPFLSTATTTTPAKRPFERTTDMANGSPERRPKPPPPPIVVTAGYSAFRLLCHVSKIGGVIGKSGSIINVFRNATGAKIRVEESVPSCEERVILVVAPENPKRRIQLTRRALASCEVVGKIVEEEHEVSAAQEALVRVFERVLEVEAEAEGAGGGAVSCRLLAAKSQVGSVMGRGGKNIEKIRKVSGAKIRVLPADQLPACAAPSDELIQIMGDALSVKKALVAVSRCLQESPPSDKAQMVSRPRGTVPHSTLPDTHGELPSQRNSLLPPTPGSTIGHVARGHSVTVGIDRITTMDQKKAQPEVSFRLLCSHDKVGGVIGKGGTIVKALQNETGAAINAGASVAESEERVITISAPENPESRFSQAQTAVIRVFNRSVEAGIERGSGLGLDKVAPVSARLLVPTSHIGCLMGKGGLIIQEMRKVTGASIRILGGDQVPKCASENDEVVQITGELGNVQDALFHVTSRLRDYIFPAKMLNGPRAGAYSSTLPEIPSFGRVEPTSPRLYPSVGLPHSLDAQATLTHSMDHLGLSNSTNRPSSPRSWSLQTIGGGNTDTGRGLTSLRGGIERGSGTKSAIVTNTTVDIVVPENVFGLVYGEKGSNLNRIRQISGATVTVRGPRPGASEGMVTISGTPDQTQAAQSLLHAFILRGQA